MYIYIYIYTHTYIYIYIYIYIFVFPQVQRKAGLPGAASGKVLRMLSKWKSPSPAEKSFASGKVLRKGQ